MYYHNLRNNTKYDMVIRELSKRQINTNVHRRQHIGCTCVLPPGRPGGLHLFVGCLLVVFNVPSTARSFRDGTPIYCPLRRT